VDRVASGGGGVYAPLCVYFVLTVAVVVLQSARRSCEAVVTAEVEARVSGRFFEHLLRMSVAFHARRKAGAVVEIMDRATTAVESLMSTFLFRLAPLLVSSVLVSAVFWQMGNGGVAACLVVSVLAFGGFSWYVTRTRMRLQRRSNNAADAASSREVESLQLYETVRSHARTAEEVGVYARLREESRAAAADTSITTAVLFQLQGFITMAGRSAGLLIAAWATAYGTPRLSPGDFVLVSLYISRLFSPLQSLVWELQSVGDMFTDLEKAVVLLLMEPEIVDADGAVDLMLPENRLRGEIVFENVFFRYKPLSPEEAKMLPMDEEDSDDVAGDGGSIVSDGDAEGEGGEEKSPGGVSNISFRVPAGKTVALVGTSGSGKSTICRLLLRLYDVDEGRIFVDSHDIRSVTQISLRRSIGLVPQEVVLFNDTIRYNLQYGVPEASDVQILDSLKAAAMGSFLKNQEEGIDTVVGDRGCKCRGLVVLIRSCPQRSPLCHFCTETLTSPSCLFCVVTIILDRRLRKQTVRLSGGERQRVGSARVFMKLPRVMVLDEASSALDSKTESTIQEEMKTRFGKTTTLMIAHRLSTIIHSDEILVLQKGEIIERGTHAELVELPDGTYANMWRLQTTTDDDSSCPLPSETAK
jgi:ABC-type multidrug transport system fused ATPase/permease subunit